MGDFAAPLLGPWTAILSFLAILVINTISWLAKRHKVCALDSLAGTPLLAESKARSINSERCAVMY